jgi:predicted solute-binding protein
MEDLGHLILYNVRKSIFPIHEICESVERSNHLKRKTRILEGSLSLISAELVISVAERYHVLNGWSGPESPFNLSDIRLFIPA